VNRDITISRGIAWREYASRIPFDGHIDKIYCMILSFQRLVFFSLRVSIDAPLFIIIKHIIKRCVYRISY